MAGCCRRVSCGSLFALGQVPNPDGRVLAARNSQPAVFLVVKDAATCYSTCSVACVVASNRFSGAGVQPVTTESVRFFSLAFGKIHVKYYEASVPRRAEGLRALFIVKHAAAGDLLVVFKFLICAVLAGSQLLLPLTRIEIPTKYAAIVSTAEQLCLSTETVSVAVLRLIIEVCNLEACHLASVLAQFLRLVERLAQVPHTQRFVR